MSYESKVHRSCWQGSTRGACGTYGKVTDDPDKVTCELCKKYAAKTPDGATNPVEGRVREALRWFEAQPKHPEVDIAIDELRFYLTGKHGAEWDDPALDDLDDEAEALRATGEQTE